MRKRYRVIAVSPLRRVPTTVASTWTHKGALREMSRYPQRHRDGGLWAFKVERTAA